MFRACTARSSPVYLIQSGRRNYIIAMGIVKESVKVVLLFSLLFLCLGMGYLFSNISPADIYQTRCKCPNNNGIYSVSPPHAAPAPQSPLSRVHLASSTSKTLESSQLRPKYLSYQPPGNGWNNQRIVLENAIVLAKLLNRTLVVHPLSPHGLGNRLKLRYHSGYAAYNALNITDLLPLSKFLDLRRLSALVPVLEVNTTHARFRQDFGNMTWRGVCHSPGYGFWVDEVPEWREEVELLARQKFSSLGKIWRERCKEEKKRYQRYLKENGSDLSSSSHHQPPTSPIIRFVSDLVSDPSDMLYFEEGTLFGIQIRFITHERALAAQEWVVDSVRYNADVWERVGSVIKKLGGRKKYNAIQVRRGDHMDRNLAQSFWIERMVGKNFSKETPVYVATYNTDPLWFKPFFDEGYKLYFSVNFTDVLSFKDIRESLRNDYLGIHEQCLCEAALHFVPSPASTFNAFILRQRGEVRERDGLMVDTLHTYWIKHQSKDKIS